MSPYASTRQFQMSPALLAFAITLFALATQSQAEEPLLHLAFDDAKDISFRYGSRAPEAETAAADGELFEIGGMAEFAPGVVGTALKFDGFTSLVEGRPSALLPGENSDDEEDEPGLPDEISIDAWIALGAYPWNWAPILTIGQYKITGFYFGVDSRGRVGFHVSDATSVWHECNSQVDSKTRLGLPLREWAHVVGTYSPKQGLTVYVNGEVAAKYNDFQFKYGIVYSQLEDGFRIGRNRVALPPTDPIRDWATYPSDYSFDGLIDELKVHARALTPTEVRDHYRNTKPDKPPAIKQRQFPKIPNSGRFAANYTRLKYYPEWDRLWPVGDDMDVVVQFDENPAKLVFWRGTRYSACWLTENGRWMADQSRETGNNWFLSRGTREEMPTGCIEHMSDTQCRSSRVKIIENNDARCVVNWQYLQMDVKFRQQDVPNQSGFGEWGNEYYYVYPDGVAVRALKPGYGGWQETIFLNEPGTRPEDNIELEACTLVNMDGESRSYSWEHGYPAFDLDDAVIQLTNLKAKFRPFMIFREGSGFAVFNLEVRPEYSNFPWWNHWPVAQVISDGRSASAPDRAAHSSLSWGDPKGEAALYGATDQPAESLVALARSWNRPPKATSKDESYRDLGYDYKQRAYRFSTATPVAPLKLQFHASAGSPLVNLAIVVDGWNENDVSLEIEGEQIPRGRDFRYSIEYNVEGDSRLIVWIKKRTEQPTQITLTPRV